MKGVVERGWNGGVAEKGDRGLARAVEGSVDGIEGELPVEKFVVMVGVERKESGFSAALSGSLFQQPPKRRRFGGKFSKKKKTQRKRGRKERKRKEEGGREGPDWRGP
ncbi:hypothetical protein CsSME_00028510 [Camellia sinensis var. sinensis]